MAANQTGLRFLKTLKNMRLRGSSRATYAQASKSGRLYILNAFALRGKSVFKINYEKRWFYYNDAVKSSLSKWFSEVDVIACKSTFANGYSSPNKSSSKEYHHQVFLELEMEVATRFSF